MYRLRQKDVAFRNVAGEGLIVLIDRAEVLGLCPAATRIVELLPCATDLAGLAGTLARETGESADCIAIELVPFLERLAELGVVDEQSPVELRRGVAVPAWEWQVPRILFIEPMEMAAVVCTPSPPAKALGACVGPVSS